MKKFRFKETYYSFMGGVISSLASTILYEAIEDIDKFLSCDVAYVFEWISGLGMCTSCAFLLLLSSKLGEVENKYISMKADSTQTADVIWFRAIRALCEERLSNDLASSNLSPDSLDSLVDKESSAVYNRMKLMLFASNSLFLISMIFLIVSKVV